MHRFYQEQYQIDGGRQDRYAVGSDAGHLVLGYYDTTKLPIYQYLTAPSGPRYKVADNFFQGAFGGSFLNHQWLVAAQTPVYAGADHSGGASDLHTVLGTDGFGRSDTRAALRSFFEVDRHAIAAAAWTALGRAVNGPANPTPPWQR